MKFKIAIAFCCLVALGLAGCGKNLPKPERPPIAPVTGQALQNVTAEMQNFGANINTYKALGKVVIKKNGQLVLSGRAGWSAEMPNKLSLVAFAAGIPVMRMACDGQSIYYADSFGKSKKLIYYTAKNTADTMYDYLGIFISTQSLLQFWMGKVMPPGYVITGQSDTVEGRCVIMSAPNGDLRYVYLDSQSGVLRRVDDFTKDGGLKYRVYLDEMQYADGTRVPYKVFITNTQNTDVEFYLDNAWVNTPTDPGMWVLWPEE